MGGILIGDRWSAPIAGSLHQMVEHRERYATGQDAIPDPGESDRDLQTRGQLFVEAVA